MRDVIETYIRLYTMLYKSEFLYMFVLLFSLMVFCQLNLYYFEFQNKISGERLFLSVHNVTRLIFVIILGCYYFIVQLKVY